MAAFNLFFSADIVRFLYITIDKCNIILLCTHLDIYALTLLIYNIS